MQHASDAAWRTAPKVAATLSTLEPWASAGASGGSGKWASAVGEAGAGGENISDSRSGGEMAPELPAGKLSIPELGGGASTGERGAEGCPSSSGLSLPQLAAAETATKGDGLPLGVINSGIAAGDPEVTCVTIIRGGGD